MKYIYIPIFLLVIFSCENKKSNQESSIKVETQDEHIDVTKTQFESEKMKIGGLTEQSFNESVTTTGYIDVPPKNKASVSSFVEGYVKNTPLLVGDVVKKDQLIVTLENTEFIEIQQNYLEAAEKLSYLKSEYKRQKTLFDENITSEKNYLKAESVYKSNLAHYNGLKQKLRMMNINPKSVEEGNFSPTINIYAPISGSVTKVNVSNGSFVSASSEVVEIINTDHIHLELLVFEKDILKIKKHQPIEFKVPEAISQRFQAEVYLVGNSVDETNRTIKVHGHIEKEIKASFVTGMFVEADIITSTNKSLALPKSAVVEMNDEYFVLVVKLQDDGNYAFEKKEVFIGKQSRDYYEVKNSEIFTEAQILTKGAFMLISNGEGGGHSH